MKILHFDSKYVHFRLLVIAQNVVLSGALCLLLLIIDFLSLISEGVKGSFALPCVLGAVVEWSNAIVRCWVRFLPMREIIF